MNLLENQRAADQVAGLYQDLEELLMSNIIRHCQNWDQPIASDTWLLQKLAEIGKLDKENIQIIARHTGLSMTAMERMLQEAAEDAIGQLEPGMQELARRKLVGEAVDAKKSRNVRQTMNALREQARDTLNLCNTTMLYKAREAYQNLVKNIVTESQEIAEKQSFLDILNKHASAAVIGAESRHQAMTKCIREFSERGIPAFVDKKGREWTPEAYVNMAMRNTVKNVADEVQNERLKDFGQDLIEIDSHEGARPKCAKDQGKIYSLSGRTGYTTDAKGNRVKYYSWKDTSYGEPDGILGINCTHHKWLFFPGMSIRRYFPTEDMDANNKLYRQTQVQRALERSVRKQKRECMLQHQAGNEEGFEKASVKLKEKEAALKKYVDGNPKLHRRKDREQVVGFDKSTSTKAVAIYKKKQKELAQKVRNDKIESELKEAGIKGEVKVFPEKPDLTEFAFDDKHINQERAHQVSRKEAEQWIRESDITLTRWKGRFVNYYSPDGAVYVDMQEKNIRTAFGKEEFDSNVKKIREVMKKYGEEGNVPADGRGN